MIFSKSTGHALHTILPRTHRMQPFLSSGILCGSHERQLIKNYKVLERESEGGVEGIMLWPSLSVSVVIGARVM